MTPQKAPWFKTTVRSCARCEGDHSDIPVYRFTLPPDTGHAGFSDCPQTGEPILFEVEETD